MPITSRTQPLKVGAFFGNRSFFPVEAKWDSFTESPVTIAYREVTSVSTPGFKGLKKKSLPVNPFEFVSLRMRESQARSLQYWESSNEYHLIGSSSGAAAWGLSGASASDTVNVPGSHDPDIATRARAQLRKHIQGAKVNLAQAFAERGQTVSMVTHTVARVATAYSALRKGQVGSALKTLNMVQDKRNNLAIDRFHRRYAKHPKDAASSLWLELNYGWRPLLSDVYGSCELLAERIKSKPVISRVSGSSRSHKSVVRKLVFAGYDVGAGTWSSEDDARYSLEYSVSNEMAQALGKTGVTNPALLVWELLPYSFVVDWFIPVGAYLESFTAFDGLTFLKGMRQQRTKRRVTAYASSNQVHSGHEISCECDYEFSGIRYTRAPLAGFPGEDPPVLKNPFSASHVSSALALLNNAFRR